MLTPNHTKNLEMYFIYPGDIYPYPACGGYQKAVFGMFYNCQLKLLSVASFGFKQHNLTPTTTDSDAGMTKNNESKFQKQTAAESEFRIYSKFLDNANRRVDIGNLWHSVWIIKILLKIKYCPKLIPFDNSEYTLPIIGRSAFSQTNTQKSSGNRHWCGHQYQNLSWRGNLGHSSYVTNTFKWTGTMKISTIDSLNPLVFRFLPTASGSWKNSHIYIPQYMLACVANC